MKKYITSYNKGTIFIETIDENRKSAWTELTNIGAVIDGCFVNSEKLVLCYGQIIGDLIQIEQLERDGWVWK